MLLFLMVYVRKRVALFSAKANNPELTIKKIAITCSTDDFMINEPIAPCQNV